MSFQGTPSTYVVHLSTQPGFLISVASAPSYHLQRKPFPEQLIIKFWIFTPPTALCWHHQRVAASSHPSWVLPSWRSPCLPPSLPMGHTVSLCFLKCTFNHATSLLEILLGSWLWAGIQSSSQTCPLPYFRSLSCTLLPIPHFHFDHEVQNGWRYLSQPLPEIMAGLAASGNATPLICMPGATLTPPYLPGKHLPDLPGMV